MTLNESYALVCEALAAERRRSCVLAESLAVMKEFSEEADNFLDLRRRVADLELDNQTLLDAVKERDETIAWLKARKIQMEATVK